MIPEIDKADKIPEAYNFITYVWMVILASAGGTVAFIRKVKSGHARAWNFTEFIGELFTSAFAGVMTFLLCQAAGIDLLKTAGLVGIAGHMGSRAIFMLEKYLAKKFPGAEIDEEGNKK